MNDGVRILLERMKTHPEEFIPNNGSSKWGSLIAAYKEFLEPEDRQVLTEGMNKLLQQAFTEKVMQELIDPQLRLKLGAIPKGMFGDPVVKKEGTTQTI